MAKGCRRDCWDHPRTCGNHARIYPAEEHRLGSPPHMREPRLMSRFGTLSRRITPAHAGTTHSTVQYTPSCRDHPRTCGNHQLIAFLSVFFMGSPPHMREPLEKLRKEVARLRITPAHAGTTAVYNLTGDTAQDHPRTCGNHIRDCHAVLNCLGSPPHMREPLTTITHKGVRREITPAHAGTTQV